MEMAMVGLGKMGANMVQRLLRGKHRIVVHDLNGAAVAALVQEGAVGAQDLTKLVQELKPPRIVWVMVPAGDPTEKTLQTLLHLLQRGDILIDGGNSNYQDSQRRAATASERGVAFVDVGTSGGIWGKAEGYSMMVGGEAAAVNQLKPIFSTLAPGPERGWGHVGPSGAGHFVKMVHNGIEYGLMQAYAEGFNIMERKESLKINLQQVAEIWRFGSVVRSWLLDLLAQGLQENPTLQGIGAQVADSGEGRWTVAEAIALNVPAPVITVSLMERLRSRDPNSLTYRLLSLMRHKFGGHAVTPLEVQK